MALVDDALAVILRSKYSIFFIFEEFAKLIGLAKNEAFDSVLELARLAKKPSIVVWPQSIEAEDEQRIKKLLEGLNIVCEFKTAMTPQALFEIGLEIKSFISAREMPA